MALNLELGSWSALMSLRDNSPAALSDRIMRVLGHLNELFLATKSFKSSKVNPGSPKPRTTSLIPRASKTMVTLDPGDLAIALKASERLRCGLIRPHAYYAIPARREPLVPGNRQGGPVGGSYIRVAEGLQELERPWQTRSPSEYYKPRGPSKPYRCRSGLVGGGGDGPEEGAGHRGPREAGPAQEGGR
jgi:hypothetical protein